MSIPRRVTDFLESRHIPYSHATHAPVYTAQETAQAQHVAGDELAKTVMVVADGRLLMAVVPASRLVDMQRLAEVLEVTTLRLADEEEFKSYFAGCEVGAMPPFGNLYDRDVWVDTELKRHPTIVFNAGTHTDTISMKFRDFQKLVHPHLGHFAAKPDEVTKES